MSFKKTVLFAATCVSIILFSASCSRYSVYSQPTISKGGPPAHAPAHGYRRKHVAGMELVFDSSLGLYVVVGLSDHYYSDGYFYRLRGGFWEMSKKPDIGWKVVSQSSLPVGLQIKFKAKGKGNGNDNGRGNGRAKHKKDVARVGRPF
jgi:hypothetical protein